MILALPSDYGSVSDTECKRIVCDTYFLYPLPLGPPPPPKLDSLRVMLGVRAERHSGNKYRGVGAKSWTNIFLSLAGNIHMELSKPNLGLDP